MGTLDETIAKAREVVGESRQLLAQLQQSEARLAVQLRLSRDRLRKALVALARKRETSDRDDWLV
jgi:hypothetical protein